MFNALNKAYFIGKKKKKKSDFHTIVCDNELFKENFLHENANT